MDELKRYFIGKILRQRLLHPLLLSIWPSGGHRFGCPNEHSLFDRVRSKRFDLTRSVLSLLAGKLNSRNLWCVTFVRLHVFTMRTSLLRLHVAVVRTLRHHLRLQCLVLILLSFTNRHFCSTLFVRYQKVIYSLYSSCQAFRNILFSFKLILELKNSSLVFK